MTKIYDLVDEFNRWDLLPSSAEFDDVYLDPYFDEDEDIENKLRQLRRMCDGISINYHDARLR